jgi:hypothetical protein
MNEGSPYPTLITPRVEGLSLHEWSQQNQDWIQSLFEEHRVLLFRDFDLGGSKGFAQVTDVLGNGERLPYRDRSTPRETHGDKVYCTTIYPSEHSIRLHNEGSYWAAHPLKAIFGCITPSETGGETPLGDVHGVHERIDPAIREEFVRRGWMLMRNYNAGFGLPWQEVFQTQDKSEAEDYCRKTGIDFEWRSDDHLRTRSVRPPVLHHPRTGEALWHNHAAFFHITSREEPIRESLQAEYASEDLPYNTYYGDGGEIDPEVIEHINAAYDAEKFMFRWREGDVSLIDNLRIAHARQPYTGDRLILVALMEPWTPEAA